jgi:AraC-like DNA-binding protein
LDYFEYPVISELSPYVQCIWRLMDAAPSDHVQAIYPDGRCEFIVHLSTPMRRLHPDGSWEQQAQCLFAGQQTEAIRLQAQSAVDCIGIRLNPPASEIAIANQVQHYTDRIIDLDSVNTEFAHGLVSAVQNFSNTQDMTPLNQALLHQFQSKPLDLRMQTSVQLIDQSMGICAISPLAAQAGMSLRSFQYQFQQTVGLSAKNYARVIRLQATLRLLDQPEHNIVALSETMGFSDQAHATRELKRITGLTPARLRNALRNDRDDETTIQLAAAFVRGRSLLIG